MSKKRTLTTNDIMKQIDEFFGKNKEQKKQIDELSHLQTSHNKAMRELNKLSKGM